MARRQRVHARDLDPYQVERRRVAHARLMREIRRTTGAGRYSDYRLFNPDVLPYYDPDRDTFKSGDPNTFLRRNVHGTSQGRYRAAMERGQIRFDAHPHMDPTHHLGPCSPSCRAGVIDHPHKLFRRRVSENPSSPYFYRGSPNSKRRARIERRSR